MEFDYGNLVFRNGKFPVNFTNVKEDKFITSNKNKEYTMKEL